VNIGPILAAVDETVLAFARRWPNLADARLGAAVVAVSDEFFAPCARMLDPRPAVFLPDKYDAHGKWMDGWETRRRRDGGHDWCILRLAAPARLRAVDIDTSHFTGNYPPAAALEGCLLGEGRPTATTAWREILPPLPLGPDAHHPRELPATPPVDHIRLSIFPDGGIARLRLFGEPACDWELPAGETVELSALLRGGRVIAWNDAHYGDPLRIIAPGRGRDMGDGWETRRRREPGHDWILIALGHPGRIERIEIDTAHFKGNFPDRCWIDAALVEEEIEDSRLVAASLFWSPLLPERPLSADSIHRFEGDDIREHDAISHVRLAIFPDGGISRMRLFGRPVRR